MEKKSIHVKLIDREITVKKIIFNWQREQENQSDFVLLFRSNKTSWKPSKLFRYLTNELFVFLINKKASSNR